MTAAATMVPGTRHAPGRVCDECEGFCLQPVPRVDAGVEISLRIGQRVRHRDYKGRRVTGVVAGLSLGENRALEVDIVLDAPIKIEAGEGQPFDIWRQHVAAHELTPFDDRDEVIAELLAALQDCIDAEQPMQQMHAAERGRAAIAKAKGRAS